MELKIKIKEPLFTWIERAATRYWVGARATLRRWQQ
jgi:hypothetical protein